MSVPPLSAEETSPRRPLHRPALSPIGPPRPVTLSDGTQAWLVSRYDDVRQVLGDSRFGRAELHAAERTALPGNAGLVGDPDLLFNQDGAGHLRLRRALGRAFTPRTVARWRPWVTEIVDRSLGRLTARQPPVDVVAEFARPLPVAVIGRLMGLDPSLDEQLRRWSEYAFTDGSHPAQDVERELASFYGFGSALLADRRQNAGEDLVSSLVRAADAEGGIPEGQLVALVCGLVTGGQDSTATMIGNSLLHLLGERLEDWPRLADETAAGIAADRLLHMIPLGDDPGSLRRARTDTEVGGVVIPAGAVVVADCATANRDPAAFPADQADDLFTPLPRPTLSFGGGRHYCLGVWLARLELTLALNRLAVALPRLRLAESPEEVVWRLGGTSRSPARLLVTW
ncbi:MULTISPECIES: cytochrome P450 [Streptomyces]|uniref:Cytochrome P450 n=1 Tax=Streptomyces prasinus TaxID=67345 RepID=A0ABX6B1T2_9ACTN|nr:cytochrome P450 [Streptomyces prasinus]